MAAVLGYLLGSFPTAVLVGRIRGIDPRMRGDQNPGWWNMRGLVGDRLALLVLIGDVGKGALAAWAGSALWGPWWTAYVAVLFAMIGHALPLFAKFHGGRSVLTWLGGMAVLAPLAVAIALGVGFITCVATRHLLHGSRASAFAIPVAAILFLPFSRVLATIALMAFIATRFFAQAVVSWPIGRLTPQAFRENVP